MGDKTSTPHLMSSLSPQQSGVNQQLSGLFRNSIPSGATPYPGPLTAPLSQGLMGIQSYLNNPSTLAGLTGPSASQQSALNTLISGKPSFDLSPGVTNQYFNDAVAAPLLQTYDRQIAPRLNQQFANLGATFTSNRVQQQQRQLSDLQSNLATQRGTLAYQDQSLAAQLSDSAAQRQLQGLSLAPQIQQMGVNNANSLATALNSFQTYDQTAATAKYQDFLRTAPENNPLIGQAVNYLGQSQTLAYQQPSQFAQNQQMAQSVMQFLPLLAAFL